MVSTLVLSLGLLAAEPSSTATVAETRAAYQAEKAHAGHDAESQVRLALWCEQHGLTTERLKHLTLALLADPKNVTARGLMGLVAYQGRWTRPEEVRDRIAADAALAAALAEYNARREAMPNTAAAHWELAQWCREKGLTAEAEAHLTAVTRLRPKSEAAWKQLGYKRYRGRWVTDAMLAAERAEADAQRKADAHWRVQLTSWKEQLARSSGREKAEQALAGVTDPRAVPAICRVFGRGGPSAQEHAVQLLAQITSPAATRALVVLTVAGKSAEVRRRAGESLLHHDPREYVSMLIGLVRKPVNYEVRPVGGPGSPGVLFLEGERFNLRRLYSPPALPARDLAILQQFQTGFFVPMNRGEAKLLDVASQATPIPSVNPGAPAPVSAGGVALADIRLERSQRLARDLQEARRAVISSQLQLENDLRAVLNYNNLVTEANGRIVPLLSSATGQDFGDDQPAWTKWWTDQLGYAYDPPQQTAKPTFEQAVPSAYQPSYARVHNACFAQGTPVRTQSGLRPIETLRVGDQVLTQDTTTGALSFQPIVQVFHNKPAATVKIDLGAETITATGIHRFWIAGKGWTMARELKPGDRLRTLGGLAEVRAVETDQVQPVYNLEVALGRSFFVGTGGLLVHDNTIVEPVLHPFDAAPVAVATAEPAGRD